MICSYKFRNFCSFADWTTVSFEVGKHAPETDSFFISPACQKLTKMLAVMGANGSGKTNLLKSLVFLRWFMLDSFRDIEAKEKIPVDPFEFIDQPDARADFELNFEVNKEAYRYVLSLNPDCVLNEELHKKADRNYRYIYKRWRDEADNQLHIQVKDGGEDVSALEKLLAGRENAALFSLLKQLGAKQFEDIFKNFDSIYSNVVRMGRKMPSIPRHFALVQNAAEFCANNPEHKKRIEDILSRLDLGLTGLDIKKETVKKQDSSEPMEVYFPYGLHEISGNSYSLPMLLESSGTQRLFIILRWLLPVLADGSVAIMDEFESDLHPHMIPPILDLFNNPETNPHNAQLLFSCHSAEVLTSLDKTQVVLVQKEKDTCKSEAWRLDEIKGVRRDDNLYAKYMAGAYGGVPNI